MRIKFDEIESYLRSKGRIRRRGAKAELEFCPFCEGGEHKDKWKFVVYLDAEGGNYRCMRGSCDVSGNFWKLAEHFGDDPRPYYTDLVERKNGHSTNTVAPILRPAVFPFKAEPVEPEALTEDALKYLHKRGFTDEVLEEVSIWCDGQGKINFGYYHKGELCMVKVREPRKPKSTEQKAWQKWKGGLRTLWGLEQCDRELDYVVITFGEYDRLALQQARVANAVSVPCGDLDLEWINICWDELERFSRIILWLDADDAGAKALPRIAERLGPTRIQLVKSPYKDANEHLVFRGKEIGPEAAEKEVWDTVADAEWMWHGDLIQISDIAEAEQCFDGYTSGIEAIDKALGGFFFKQLIVHTGDTKNGKSIGVNQIAAQAVQQGGVVCMWPGEDNTEDFKYKFYTHIAGFEGTEKRLSNRTSTSYAYIKPEYQERIDNFLREKVIVLDRRFGIDENILLDNFLLAFQRFGCDTFVVDNLMKIVAAKDSDNVNFRQGRICNLLSDFAKEHRVTVHLVTHTNKTGADNEPPTRRSISGAKEIINLADRVISWWRIPAAEKLNYEGAETLVSILADRSFGAEQSTAIRFHPLIKRYGQTIDDFNYHYSI